MTSRRDREHIFERLRSGVVPERGLGTDPNARIHNTRLWHVIPPQPRLTEAIPRGDHV